MFQIQVHVYSIWPVKRKQQ